MKRPALNYPAPIYNLIHVTSSLWAGQPNNQIAEVLTSYMDRAWQVIREHLLPIPASLDRLELTVKLAAEAEMLFFNAAINEPTREEIELFFADFLCRSLQQGPAIVQ